jgi:DNA-binding beta-propeller fold protein YncE
MSSVKTRRLFVALACALCGTSVAAGAAAADQFGFVANQGDGTVTPVDLTTGTAQTPFDVGSSPAGVALTPDGSTLLAANSGDDTVTPVAITTGTSGLTFSPGTPIPAGSGPDALAITGDGATAYVTDDGSDTVTPITLEGGVDIPGTPLNVAAGPDAIALTPNGELAYVTSDSGWVTPIITSTNGISTTPPAIRIGANPDSIAIAPNGQTGYVTDSAGGTITQFAIPSDQVGTPINVGSTPNAIAISPDGSTAWVANNITPTSASAEYALTPINLASDTLSASIALPWRPSAIVISGDGSTAYVTEYEGNEVLPVTLPSGPVGNPIPVGTDPSALAITDETGEPVSGGSGSGSSPTGYTFPVTGQQTGTVGNQTLTLTISGSTTSPTAACLRATGSISSRLTAKSIKHRAALKFVQATFTLGKTSKRVKHLPATVKLPLKGLKPGRHTVSVAAVYSQHVSRTVAKHVTKTLHTNITIC